MLRKEIAEGRGSVPWEDDPCLTVTESELSHEFSTSAARRNYRGGVHANDSRDLYLAILEHLGDSSMFSAEAHAARKMNAHAREDRSRRRAKCCAYRGGSELGLC